MDTCPDLTMARSTRAVIPSEPLDETLGTDHYLVATDLALTGSRRPERRIRIKNWAKFREPRTASPEVDGYDDWLASLSADLEATTRSINTTPTNPDVDPHLLHFGTPSSGLTKRWKRQCLNRRLNVWIARIPREAQEYARILTRNNWRGFCNSLSGTLSTAKTWSIHRALVDPSLRARRR
ncbi:hypothetical protein HPB50_002889 [Hyalomma asiaticum]|uniref:Uncharacterized protein n=1 Tax=Hyalomma asiaticum TaxID=266040 RepID=A0ACB7TG69_HYAAI|nr:hypothetical protein HPB50_002889 [Hyalomma asiaticum]